MRLECAWVIDDDGKGALSTFYITDKDTGKSFQLTPDAAAYLLEPLKQFVARCHV